MNEHDAELLAAIRDSLERSAAATPEVHLTVPPAGIMTRGRGRRRLFRAIGGAALGVALIVGAALGARLLTTGQPQPRPAHHAPAKSAPAAPHLAAWTVTRDPNGIVTITLRQASDPDRLRQALAQAGVPAIVVVRRVCGPTSVTPQVPAVFADSGPVSGGVFIRVRPSAMPPGTEILVAFQAVSGLGPLPGPPAAPGLTSVELIWDYQAAQVYPVNGQCPNLGKPIHTMPSATNSG